MITYRHCTQDDISRVLEFWRNASVPGSTDSEVALSVRLGRDGELFLLAWDGDLLVGTLIGGWDGWRGNMYRLAVLPSHRGRGIARQLVERIEEALVRMGARRIYALSMRESPEAARFWTALGYTSNTAIDPMVKSISTD